MSESSRSAAVRFLLKVDKGLQAGKMGGDPLYSALSPLDRSFARELVFGVLRQKLLLDFEIDCLLREGSKLDPVVRQILRIGVYQLQFMGVPDRAAVHETVGLCRKLRRHWASKLTNAVLRGYQRNPPEVPPGSDARSVSIRFSHPEWLVKRYLGRYGLAVTTAALKQNNQVPEGFFWVNPRKISTRDFSKMLETHGVNHESVPGEHQCLIVDPAFAGHPAYGEGWGFFMDLSSQRVVSTLDLQRYRRLADLCAAPGGKTFLLASHKSARARLVSADVSFRRLRGLQKRAIENGFATLDLLCQDMHAPALQPLFDFVLLDAPCSGLGTLRSNPDIRWKVEASGLQRMADRQRKLIRAAYSLLVSGGEVVYSTCSTEQEENEEVVDWLLERESLATLAEKPLCTFPDASQGEGFFSARILRR